MRLISSILIIFCFSINPVFSEIISNTDQNISLWNLGNGVITYKYKKPVARDILEWQQSAIANDLIELNLISLPSIVYDSNSQVYSYPLLDVLQLPYEKISPYYHEADLRLTRKLWTSDGYDVYDFNSSPRFQIKVSPSIRHEKVKYEHNYYFSDIKLPKISLRVANLIFPEKFKLNGHMNKNSEARDFWQYALSTNRPIIFTDGFKKALSLLSHGYLAISVHGFCTCMKANNLSDKNSFVLIDEIETILSYQKRLIYISFDNDDDLELSNLAKSAEFFFANKLIDKVSDLKIIQIREPGLKGVDDYIYSKGRDAYQVLIDKAVTLEVFEKQEKPKNFLDYFEIYLKNKEDYKWCFDHAEFMNIEPEVLWSFKEFNKD
jgi:hypothetical protein